MTTEPVAQFSNSVPCVRILSAGYDRAGRDALDKLALEFTKIAGLFRVTLNHPDTKGGLALLNRLRDACEDETIMASPAALALAKAMTELLADASIGATVDEVFDPLTTLAAKQAISNDKRKAAKSKNIKARSFVLSKWEIRTDQGQSKAAFARQYAELLRRNYSLNVTPDTIARDWLPTAKK